jgi:two-component system, LytTR family, response regulator
LRDLRVLIADDEQVARQRLRRLLAEASGAEIAGECKNGREVLDRVREGGIDVILLDIHMPGLTGLEALRALPEPAPYVIFCTAHAEHAVAAFEDGALDYLLKPVTGPRLEKALARARSRDQQTSFQQLLARLKSEPAAPDRLAVPGKHGIQLIDPIAVSHAVLEGELVTLSTEEGKLFSDFSLQELEARLPKDRFVRVHRRALVNLHRVLRLEPAETGGFYALMRSGERVEVSRQAARELKRRLGIARASPEDDKTNA